MTKRNLIIVFILLASVGFGQTTVRNTQYTQFQLKLKNDTIDFVIADTNLNVKKPLLLFCQGSQPVPLFFDFGDNRIVPVSLSNFNLEELNEKFHVAVISMPKIPLIAGMDHLNSQYNYITDKENENSYLVDYQKADYSENYVERANKVLKFLRKQKWIEEDKVVVAGHSQGARIAVCIAAANKNVTHLGLFGYNPNGRIDQSFRRIRKMAEFGDITWEEADSLQQEQVDFYKIVQNSDSVAENPGLVSWNSFSKPTLNLLTDLKIPVYIAYGSSDIVADFCDLLPLYFIEKGKENYELIRYPNLEHNFFPLDESGRPIHSEGKWNSVMNQFIEWAIGQ